MATKQRRAAEATGFRCCRCKGAILLGEDVKLEVLVTAQRSSQTTRWRDKRFTGYMVHWREC